MNGNNERRRKSLYTAAVLWYSWNVPDSFVVHDITSYMDGEKNTFLILCIVLTVDVIMLFFWVLQKIAVWRITGKYSSERITESLQIKDDLLEYGYRNYATRFVDAADRVIVRIKLDQATEIKISDETGRIEITAQVSSMYYDDWLARETRA